MTKIKQFFKTPKKAVISSACVLAVLGTVGTGTAYATSTIARTNSIGAVNAQNYAFADAGVDPASAQVMKTQFDFEQGQFIYEVTFTANGTEYDYQVKASDGSIVKKAMEIPGTNGQATSLKANITLEEAKHIALTDAGLSASGVTFTETKLEREGQLPIYDLSFYTADAKYEYDVNAETGNVYSKSKEALMSQQKATASVQETKAVQATTAAPQTQAAKPSLAPQKTQASNGDGLEAAKNTALADAGVSVSSATFIKARQDYDDGRALYDIEFYTSTHKYEYEISVNSGTIVERSVEAFRTDARSNTGNSGSYIGMERAKSIALSHAGASASAVIFSKEHQDYDDGRMEYEVEFYYNGMEYEYTIDATSGTILEYDFDRD